MTGPTLEEVEAACNGFSRMYPDLATTWTDEMWRVLNAVEPIIRARHVREAVEGLTRDDAICAIAAAANAYDVAKGAGQSHDQAEDAAHSAFRAALLAALTATEVP